MNVITNCLDHEKTNRRTVAAKLESTMTFTFGAYLSGANTHAIDLSPPKSCYFTLGHHQISVHLWQF
jgi:hypothetical protein